MSTVIDELIVVLGIDSRQWTEGQRDALAAFKKTKDSALDFGKAIEESAGKSAEALGFVRKGALGLIGAFAGVGNHSMMVTTKSDVVLTAIRLGNTGAQQNLPQLVAACRKGLGDRASLPVQRAGRHVQQFGQRLCVVDQ